MKATVQILVVLSALAAGPAAGAAEETLGIIARVGPWPHLSAVAGYGGRLWFVNSVKFRNHNSADVYSYDPATGQVRYQRHLFSQDAGRPLVAGGLLYWPFEDARASLGWGHYMVTDGRRWRLGTLPTARIFHTHAMAEAGGRLVAATSAWRAGLQASDDNGGTWRQLYDHPTPKGRVSRIVELAALGRRVFGYVVGRREDGRPERRLLVLHGDAVAEVPGWPKDRPVLALAAWRGWVYGLVDAEGGTAVWRTDGDRVEPVAPPRRAWNAIHLAAGAGGLWAVSAEARGGAVWHSSDGGDWRRRYRLAGGQPREAIVYGGAVYAVGSGDDGRGILWGPPSPAPAEPAPAPAWPPSPEPAPVDWDAAGADLDRALFEADAYESHGKRLREFVYVLARSGAPHGFFGGRLIGTLPEHTVSLIGGRVQVPASRLARWILLWGMSVGGDGGVPPSLVGEAWSAPANPSEKYFDAPPAAMWAAALAGKPDRPVIAALIARLRAPGDPLWLKGDAVGALTALTGQRLAYDFDAWYAWWTRTQSE